VESSRDRSTDGREARMATVERGCLAIGDIAGYTTYLAGVELEHSQDVLADLMGVVVMQMRGLLHLAKLEGDAVFCYNREDEATGPMLLTMTESCYSPRPTTMSERSPGTCGTTNHCVHGEYAGTIGCIDARACGPPSGSSRIVARVRRPPSMGVSSDVNVESSGD